MSSPNALAGVTGMAEKGNNTEGTSKKTLLNKKEGEKNVRVCVCVCVFSGLGWWGLFACTCVGVWVHVCEDV